MGVGDRIKFKARSLLLGQPPVDFSLATHGATSLQILSLERWLELSEASPVTQVSIITATRDRSELLRRAAISILNQTVDCWEWIVVNDGAPESCNFLLDEHALASRVRVVEAGGVGLAAARNRGLEQASGDVVCYLDDDNVMGRRWVQSLGFAIDRSPEWTWGYGARVVETPQVAYSPLKTLPFIEFPPFSRAELQNRNYIDANVLFHRSGAWRFDEETNSQSDWELALRFAETSGPLRVPAIACLYGTQHDGRMSDSAVAGDDEEMIRQKHGLPPRV